MMGTETDRKNSLRARVLSRICARVRDKRVVASSIQKNARSRNESQCALVRAGKIYYHPCDARRANREVRMTKVFPKESSVVERYLSCVNYAKTCLAIK